jgi:hypothetical protein
VGAVGPSAASPGAGAPETARAAVRAAAGTQAQAGHQVELPRKARPAEPPLPGALETPPRQKVGAPRGAGQEQGWHQGQQEGPEEGARIPHGPPPPQEALHQEQPQRRQLHA